MLTAFPNRRLALAYAAFLLLAWRFCGMTNLAYLVALAATYVLLFRRWPGDAQPANDEGPTGPGYERVDEQALPWLRWAALATLLACEAVAFALRFNVASLGPNPGGWSAVVAGFPNWSRSAAAVILATLLLAGRGALRQMGFDKPSPRTVPDWKGHWLLLVASHLGLVAAFAWLTAQILERGRGAGDEAPLWVLGWLAAGACGLAVWALCVLPLPIWRRAAASAWRVFAVAAASRVAFAFLIPASQSLWTSLAAITLWCVKGLLALVYPQVVCRPDEFIVGTPSFHVFVAPRCSGYEGIALILVFLVVYFWFDRRALRFPHVLVLLPLGAAFAFCANAVRLAALVAVGTSWSEEVAMGGFHSQAGWLALNGVALGLVGAAGRLRWFSAAATASHQVPHAEGYGSGDRSRVASGNPVAPYLMPFLGIVATSMLTGAFSAGFDWLYGLRVIVAAAFLIWYWPAYRGLFTGLAKREAPATDGRVVLGFDKQSGRPALGEDGLPSPSPRGVTAWEGHPPGTSLPVLFARTLRGAWSWQGVAWGAAAFGVWLALTPGGEPSGMPDELRTASAAWAALWLGLRAVGYIVTAPLAEELAFRGFLMRRFVSADFERVPLDRFHWLGFAGSSLLFGLMHGGAWLAATAAGMLFALAAYRRGKLADAILAHATTNAMNLVYVLATGDWARLG